MNCRRQALPFCLDPMVAVVLRQAEAFWPRVCRKFLRSTPRDRFFSAMRIYDPESGEVDIDALYQAAKPYMGTDPLPLKIPALNVTIKMGKKEIGTLYTYIKEG